MMRKYFKKIVILSLFFLLVSGFGIKHAVSKGPPKVSALICMTITGDIISSEGCRTNGIMHNTTQLLAGPMDIDLSYFHNECFHKLNDGGPCGIDCFRTGTYSRPGIAVVKDDETAVARFHFYSSAEDDPSDMHYRIRMYGHFDGDWPPKPRGVTYVFLDTWELSSWGKGADKKKSCTGSGSFIDYEGDPTIVTIVVTRGNQ